MLPLVVLFSLGCGDSRKAQDARIILTADIRGRLVPCGCFTGQLGGMTRLYTVLERPFGAPELRVDAGDALRGPQDFEIMEYLKILEAFEAMHFHALNLGARESQLSANTLRRLQADTGAPMVSANLVDVATGQPVVQPYIETRLGSRRIIVTGILDLASAAKVKQGEGLIVADPDLVLRELLPVLRQKCDVLVVLAFANENRLRGLAERFFEADFILGGDVSQPSGNTRAINQSHVFYVANESRTIGLIDFVIAPKGKQSRPEIAVHNATPLLLFDNIPEASEIVKMAIAYREAVRVATLDIDDPEKLASDQIPGVLSAAHYVGSGACISCHQAEHEIWEATAHAHAWATLEQHKADADPNCIGCHSVGFGTPSGYRREFKHEKLVNVGCESCHGPGSRHVEERSAGGPITFKFRPLAEGDCRSCHYGEFSRPFDWDQFWPAIAHGQNPRQLASPLTSPPSPSPMPSPYE